MSIVAAILLLAPVFDVRIFGAKGDGKTMDTAAVQAALDAAARKGGRVTLADGRFLCGTLELRSGVELRIEKGATLLGSTNRDDYRRNDRWYALLLAKDARGIAVTGGGTINGQGRTLAADVVRRWRAGDYGPVAGFSRPDEKERPQLIEFSRCRGVRVEGVALRDSSCWVETYKGCEDLTVKNVTVASRAYWNNDGIDLVDCRRVLVEGCDIDAADDAVCLKSEAGGTGCEDVRVRRCRLRSSASAVKLGTGSYGGFRRIAIEDIDVRDTFRSAVALEVVDGGSLDDMRVRRVRARNVGNALFMRLGHRNGAVGTFQNVVVEDVRVEVPQAKPDAGLELEGPETRTTDLLPSSIVGLPGHPIGNVTLRNVEIVFGGGGGPPIPLSQVPLKERDYPEFSMFGDLPAWGLFARDVAGLTLENVTVRLAHPDARPAFALDAVTKAAFRRVSSFPGRAGAVGNLRNVPNSRFERTPTARRAVNEEGPLTGHEGTDGCGLSVPSCLCERSHRGDARPSPDCQRSGGTRRRSRCRA